MPTAKPEVESEASAAPEVAATRGMSAIDDATVSVMVEKQKDLVKRSREAIAATKRLTLKKEFSQNILKRRGY